MFPLQYLYVDHLSTFKFDEPEKENQFLCHSQSFE